MDKVTLNCVQISGGRSCYRLIPFAGEIVSCFLYQRTVTKTVKAMVF